MAFADLFSAPAKSSGSSSSGFGSLFASAPADQVAAQQQKSSQINKNTIAAKANFAQNGGIVNILKNTILGLPSATGIGQMAKSSFNQATGALTDAATGKSTTGGLKEGLDLVTGVGGVAFSPLAPAITPIGNALSYLVKQAGNQVAKIPAISSYGRAVANIPNYDPQQETATKILEVLNSAGNASQALLGAKGGEKLAEAVPKTTPEVPIEPKAPVAAETPPTAPLSPTERTSSTSGSPEPTAEPVVTKTTQTTQEKQTQQPSTPDQTIKSSSSQQSSITPQEGALKPMRASAAASDISDTLVEKGFKSLSIDEQARYTPSTKAVQLQKVGDLMKNYLNDAISMARGDKTIPDGIHSPVLFNAVEAYANKVQDFGLMRDLAKSPLAGESSIHGQQLGAHSFNDNPHSTVRALREVQQTREPAIKSFIQKVTPRVRAAKARLNTAQTWGDFVKSIEC